MSTTTNSNHRHNQQHPHEQPAAGRAWRDRAACRGVDSELFFPTAESGPVRDAQVKEAKAVCAGCPVRSECLAEALARIPYGIAGGLTEHERRRLRTTTTGRPVTPREAPPEGLAREWNRRERAEAGRELLAAGRAPAQVASACRVSVRTVERWAAHTRMNTRNGAGEGSHGGNRAPLQVSTARDTQAGTRAPEGVRA